MSLPFTESAPATPLTPQTWYVGRCFFYTTDPAALLAAGYDRVKVYRRKTPVDEWVELPTLLPIEATKRNYVLVDPKALKTAQYRPSLVDSTGVHPEVVQTNNIQDAVDTFYDSVLTVEELKDRYMWGLLGIFQDGSGNPFPDRLYVHYLQYGISKFEHKTRIYVLPRVVQDKHDYSPREWNNYWEFMLDEFPCVSVDRVTLSLPGSDPYVFPSSWVKADLALGLVSIVPDTSESAPLLPLLRSGPKFVPDAVTIDYVAGFPLGAVPPEIRDIIGKEASSGPLNIGGDLVGGAAIASQSMSLDGLSQSVNTTSSATNAGFGSRLIQYNNELKRDYPLVQARFKGPRLYVG